MTTTTEDKRHTNRVEAIKARLPGQRITLAGVETAHRVHGYFHAGATWDLLRVCSALAKLGPAAKRHGEAECNGYPANQARYWAAVDQRIDREIRALAECFPLRRGGKLEIRRQGDPRGLTLKIVITTDGIEREIGVVGS